MPARTPPIFKKKKKNIGYNREKPSIYNKTFIQTIPYQRQRIKQTKEEQIKKTHTK